MKYSPSGFAPFESSNMPGHQQLAVPGGMRGKCGGYTSVEHMSDENSIEWTDKFSIGISGIDEQHAVLVHIINRLIIAVSKHEGDKVIRNTIDSLIEYTKAHFALEERLMDEANYSESYSHAMEHRQFTEKFFQLAEKHLLENEPIDQEMIAFLQVWFTEHVLGTDMKLGKAMNQSNFSTAEWEKLAQLEFPPKSKQKIFKWKIW